MTCLECNKYLLLLLLFAVTVWGQLLTPVNAITWRLNTIHHTPYFTGIVSPFLHEKFNNP